jgi:hypothetical protein
MVTPVYLEVGKKKIFASAVEWPGWCRAGKTEEAALEALAAYHGRYAEVADAAGVRFPKSAADTLEVVETLAGDTTTDFGAPGKAAAGEAEPVTAARAKRMAALLAGSWQVLDKIAAVTPEELRKGPRGGGRDRDKMLDHVIGAETSYARMVGIRHKQPAVGDSGALEALRADILALVSRPSDGSPPRENGWLLRYFVRRTAWHVLDHAWEMQDRTET